ncbi:hypothetical protein [Microbacterium sp.]|uniref:hypothetical protein n=1 Tax=Microbacterium sp. TaxID=51671 RepID=UPI0025D8E01E|nr:hypothetical protein [Microbacterium sp.]
MIEQPLRSPAAKARLLSGLNAESIAQQIGEEVMVAKSPVRSPRMHQEQRAPCQEIQHLGTVPVTRDCVAQIGVQPLQHRSAQQEAADARLEIIEHLLGQVVGDESVATGELVDEGVRVGYPLQRDPGQLQTRCPPFGPRVERLSLRHAERPARHRLEQVPALVPGEGEIGCPQLHEASIQPEPLQAQRGVPSSAHENPNCLREPPEQARKITADQLVVQQVHIVDHHHHLVAQAFKLRTQPVHERRPECGAADKLGDSGIELGSGGHERRHE